MQQKIQVCGKLQQPIQWLQQLHIWRQCPPFKRDATWKISFKYIQYFFRYSDLQQNLIKNAAFCSNQVIWPCPGISYMIKETKIHHDAKFHTFCRKWSLHLHPSKLNCFFYFSLLPTSTLPANFDAFLTLTDAEARPQTPATNWVRPK